MGRGLSDLQRTILRLAYENRQAPPEPDRQPEWAKAMFGPAQSNGIDVYYSEILVNGFGFPLRRWRRDEGLSDRTVARRRFTGQKFAMTEIGNKRYASAQAAVSRAFARLERRGFVELYSGAYARWSGAKLTDAGVEIAKSLPELPV